MKFLIVLFAAVAVASAFPGHLGYVEPQVVDPWKAWQPSVWPSSGWQSSGWQADPWQASAWQPTVKKIVPVVPVHAPVVHAKVHHVHQVQQPQPIPPLHPQPLAVKVHSHVTRIPYGGVHIAHPHLIGVEHYVPEPEIKVVAKSHHSW